MGGFFCCFFFANLQISNAIVQILHQESAAETHFQLKQDTEYSSKQGTTVTPPPRFSTSALTGEAVQTGKR